MIAQELNRVSPLEPLSIHLVLFLRHDSDAAVQRACLYHLAAVVTVGGDLRQATRDAC